jgi:hypothetical protein
MELLDNYTLLSYRFGQNRINAQGEDKVHSLNGR